MILLTIYLKDLFRGENFQIKSIIAVKSFIPAIDACKIV